MSLRNGAGDVAKEVAARPGEELNNVAKNIADCTGEVVRSDDS